MAITETSIYSRQIRQSLKISFVILIEQKLTSEFMTLRLTLGHPIRTRYVVWVPFIGEVSGRVIHLDLYWCYWNYWRQVRFTGHSGDLTLNYARQPYRIHIASPQQFYIQEKSDYRRNHSNDAIIQITPKKWSILVDPGRSRHSCIALWRPNRSGDITPCNAWAWQGDNN